MNGIDISIFDVDQVNAAVKKYNAMKGKQYPVAELLSVYSGLPYMTRNGNTYWAYSDSGERQSTGTTDPDFFTAFKDVTTIAAGTV